MATLLIRGLNDSVEESLRVRAAKRGRSMEADARSILEEGLRTQEPRENLYLAVRRAVAIYGGGDLELPSREQHREPPHFE